MTWPVFSTEMQPLYVDHPFLQDYTEKIPLSEELAGARLIKVRSDRNGRIQVLSETGLLQVHNGKLVADRRYRSMLDMRIKDLDTFDNQFVYLTDKVVFSNAWAGRFLVPHQMLDVKSFKMTGDFDFLVAGEDSIAYFRQGNCTDRQQMNQIQIKQICFDRQERKLPQSSKVRILVAWS
jgi:hypothetical protein